MSVLALCKFTPLGFETTFQLSVRLTAILRCKFTPLGFETISRLFFVCGSSCVNLPRWGLKPRDDIYVVFEYTKCKFTPLGFETFSDRTIGGDSDV